MVKTPMATEEIEKLLSRVLVGRLAMCKNSRPYVIPMCFLYWKQKIYFHCGFRGRKNRYVKTNPEVCFQVDEHQLAPSRVPCDFTLHYQSVLVFGKVRFREDPEEKLEILRMMLDKYDTSKHARPLDESAISEVQIGEIVVEEITGVRSSK